MNVYASALLKDFKHSSLYLLQQEGLPTITDEIAENKWFLQAWQAEKETTVYFLPI